MTKPRRAGLRGSRPVSRILSWVTILLCGYPAPRRAASTEPVHLAPDGVWLAAVSPRRWWALTPPFHPYLRGLARSLAGGLLSVPLSVGFRRLGRPSVLPCGVRTFLEALARSAVTRPARNSVAAVVGGLTTRKQGGAMKRIAALAVFAVAVAVAAGVALGARNHNGHGSPGKVIHVIEHATTDAVTNTGNGGGADNAGDILTFANPVFAKNSKQAGTDQGYCVRVVVGQSWECNWTTLLANGQ